MSEPQLPREVRRRLAIMSHAEEVIGERLPVGVKVTLGRRQRAMAGDLAETVEWHAGVGHPRQPRMS